MVTNRTERTISGGNAWEGEGGGCIDRPNLGFMGGGGNNARTLLGGHAWGEAQEGGGCHFPSQSDFKITIQYYIRLP